jgi:hypothetical protein
VEGAASCSSSSVKDSEVKPKEKDMASWLGVVLR